MLAAWDEVLPRLRRARRVCLFVDFDGTLAPIQPDPGSVRLAPPTRSVLNRLARKKILLGIVSGRSLAYLRRWVRLRDIWYAGSHGGILGKQAGPRHFLVRPAERAAIGRLGRRLASRLAGMPGIGIHRKETSVAVHYRFASARQRRAARKALETVLQQCPGMQLLPGKKVWEILPGTVAGKGRAIGWILRRHRQAKDNRRLLVFLGDDATDEQVFRTMQGISIAVGKRRQTAARYYLRSPAEVRAFLERLHEARS
ncbi:MAG TPA: trehalose-phosphatase [Terriglobia bacterium]|nr:trehalose-phosphatase [Terriglobia bacterium]